MSLSRRSFAAVVALGAVLISAGPTSAETVAVPFTSSGGVNTSAAYSGVTAFHVTGTGFSLGSTLNDAFYVFGGVTPYYNANHYHLLINGGHPGATNLPPYAPSHEYWFLYDVGANPTAVNLKVSDGNYGDNGGSYTVDVDPYTAPTPNAGGPYTTTEGAAIVLDGSASVGQGGVAGYSWDCETDGQVDGSGASASNSCIYGDDGTYTATLVVTDAYGGTATASATVSVSNVAPTITTSAPTTATEGATYAYAPGATDPAGTLDPLVWTLPTSPAGAQLDPTETVAWTPTLADALAGPASFVVQVDDGDGGTDTETWSVTVTFLDGDNDGMADTWETANGLDPTNADDATEDPDGDGLDNLAEFTGDTDPNVSDGPGGVTLVSPIGGEEVTTATPAYVVDGATDPSGDVMTLDIEVYVDAALTLLVDSVTDLAEDPSGRTTWAGTVALAENTTHHWRARASDPYVAGAWSAAESFFVNAVDEAPTAPTPWSPLDGDIVASTSPTLEFAVATDPDGDLLTHSFELELLDSTPVDAATDVGDDGVLTSWASATPLEEDTAYVLRARATDEDGLDGPWSDDVVFVVSTDDGAPTTPVIERPEHNSEVAEASPEVVASGADDPEGRPLTYQFELSLDAGFAEILAGADVPEAPLADYATWELLADGVVLDDETTHHVRVRAFDGALASDWALASFVVNLENDAPSAPLLVAPLDGAVFPDGAAVRAAWSEDSDGDVLAYDVRVASDAAFTDVVAEAVAIPGGNALLDGPGEVSFAPGGLESGTWHWTARAVDGHGLASEWAEGEAFVVPLPDAGDDDDAARDPDCSCLQSLAPAGATPPAVAFALLCVFGVRRRR